MGQGAAQALSCGGMCKMGFCLRKQELENQGGEGHKSSGPEVLAILPVFIGERALALEPSNPEFWLASSLPGFVGSVVTWSI